MVSAKSTVSATPQRRVKFRSAGSHLIRRQKERRHAQATWAATSVCNTLVCWELVLNEVAPCGTTATAVRRDAWRSSRTSVPSSSTAPACRTVLLLWSICTPGTHRTSVTSMLQVRTATRALELECERLGAAASPARRRAGPAGAAAYFCPSRCCPQWRSSARAPRSGSPRAAPRARACTQSARPAGPPRARARHRPTCTTARLARYRLPRLRHCRQAGRAARQAHEPDVDAAGASGTPRCGKAFGARKADAPAAGSSRVPSGRLGCVFKMPKKACRGRRPAALRSWARRWHVSAMTRRQADAMCTGVPGLASLCQHTRARERRGPSAPPCPPGSGAARGRTSPRTGAGPRAAAAGPAP